MMEFTVEQNETARLRLQNGDVILVKIMFGEVSQISVPPEGKPNYVVQLHVVTTVEPKGEAR